MCLYSLDALDASSYVVPSSLDNSSSLFCNTSTLAYTPPQFAGAVCCNCPYVSLGHCRAMLRKRLAEKMYTSLARAEYQHQRIAACLVFSIESSISAIIGARQVSRPAHLLAMRLGKLDISFVLFVVIVYCSLYAMVSLWDCPCYF